MELIQGSPGTALAFSLCFLCDSKAAAALGGFKDKAVPRISHLTVSFLSPFSVFFFFLQS